jgi:hypothetical protein
MECHTLIEALGEVTPQRTIIYSLAAITTYLILASSIRFHRRRTLHKEYPYQTRESMSKMTYQDAWAIQKTILQMEFPFIVLKSLQFALFRVGTPTPPSEHNREANTNPLDIRHSDYIKSPTKDVSVLRLCNFIQTLRRHRSTHRRIHGIRPPFRTCPDGHRPNQLPPQGISRKWEDSRR